MQFEITKFRSLSAKPKVGKNCSYGHKKRISATKSVPKFQYDTSLNKKVTSCYMSSVSSYKRVLDNLG